MKDKPKKVAYEILNEIQVVHINKLADCILNFLLCQKRLHVFSIFYPQSLLVLLQFWYSFILSDKD